MKRVGPYGPWILQGAATLEREPQPPPADSVRLRIFCVPQAGMGAWAFHGWTKILPRQVEVMPLELPGKNSRVGEALFRGTLVDLAAEALDGIGVERFTETPFVILGHSFGAWLAYEMALEIRRRGWPLPLKLYVSANRAPQLSSPEHDPDRQSPMLHSLSPGNFWQAFERRYGCNPDLQSSVVREFAILALQNDFRLLETYRLSDSEPCDFSIAALGARGDGRYSAEQLSAWASCCSSFSEHWFDGKQEERYWGTPHRYIVDNAQALLSFLAEDLLKMLAASDAASTA